MEADESSLLSISDPNFDVNIAYEKDTTEISQVACLLFTPISNDHCFQLFDGYCQSLSAVGSGQSLEPGLLEPEEGEEGENGRGDEVPAALEDRGQQSSQYSQQVEGRGEEEE